MGAFFFFAFLVGVWAIVFRKSSKGVAYSRDEYDLEDPAINRMGLFELASRRNTMVAYAYLGGWMMKQNNRDSREKMRFIQAYFYQYFKGAHNVSEEMVSALRNPIDLDSIAKWINRTMKQPGDKQQLVDFLIALCMEDGEVTQNEYNALLQFMRLLGLSQHQLEASIEPHKERRRKQERRNVAPESPVSPASKRQLALKCLELTETCTELEIKKAYRKLVKLHHPDKFMKDALAVQEKAAARFREIQTAYDALMEA